MRFLARLTEHWELKLLSLVFAVAVWVFVASEDKGEAVYTVPVAVTDVPPGMAVTAFGDEAVDVRVQGLRRVLARLTAQDLRVEVSLRDADSGDFVARVLPQDVTAPRSVQVLAVSPSRVRGKLEPEATPAQ